jgi:hypothetical protein
MVYVYIGLGIGSLFFYKGFQFFRQKRMIENIPTSKVRSIAMGLVEVKGDVQLAEEYFESPFSKQKCVFYNYKIQEYRGGKHKRWVTVNKKVESVPFHLEDATGKVLVDPIGFEVDVPESYSFRGGMGSSFPKEFITFLESEGMSHKSLFGFHKKMRVKEYVLKPKMSLYIMGTAGDNPHVEDGSSVKGVDGLMIQKGEGPYNYISDKHEDHLLKSLTWKAFGGVFGGGALTLFCLFLILIQFGVIV